MHLVNILLAMISIFLPVALAQRVFPEPIFLINTTYAGSGCPADSVISAFDSGLLSLQFKTTRYDLSLGKDISVVKNRKNCQIRAEIIVPMNYSITIWQNNVSGAAKLSEEVAAQFLTTVYLSSNPSQSTTFRSELKGPWNSPFAKTEEISYESPWTSCEGGVATFNFNTQVKLTLLKQAASNGTGALEPTLSQNYEFMWHKC